MKLVNRFETPNNYRHCLIVSGRGRAMVQGNFQRRNVLLILDNSRTMAYCVHYISLHII